MHLSEKLDCTEYISGVHKCEINLFKRGKEKDVNFNAFSLAKFQTIQLFTILINRIVNFLSFIINKIALREL